MMYCFLDALASLFSRFSWNTLRAIAGGLAFVVWHALPARRQVAVQSIEKHLGLPFDKAEAIARQSYRENFLSFLEIFHAGRFQTFSPATHFATPEVLELMHKETAPVVIATAHIGSWEMMPGLATDIFPARQSMVVVRSRKNSALNKVMARLRGARGMQAVDHRQASSLVLPCLRNGGITAFLVDHNCSRKEAIFLSFLGESAAVNMGPASMALRAKAAVYPVFLVRDGKGGYIFYSAPPLRTDELEGSIKDRIAAIAAFYTDAVADIVQKHPEQWFWMHKRWKTRPKTE
ncbi:lysophospholipid acyltransferase family protein [Desulfovibrio sp. OttesenSCG-928-G15]|nr:lysophospholipid acyltransferase family protein [Desulfovibrio sp. OttesenSCG-928-G15]